MAVLNAPRQRHLRAILTVLLRDFLDYRVVDEFPHVVAGTVDFVLVSEGGVLLDVDSFCFVVGGEGVLL